MNFQANIAETYNYDAWGRRRNPETWTYNNVPEPTLIDFGFTSHEHWDKVNIINMTGRLYDPYLARVLNPDPYVSDPNSSQALNRYTYAMNNPFIYSDPDGEWVQSLIKLAFDYLKAAHDGRNENGKWDWKLKGIREENGPLGVISYFLFQGTLNFNGGFNIEGSVNVNGIPVVGVTYKPENTGIPKREQELAKLVHDGEHGVGGANSRGPIDLQGGKVITQMVDRFGEIHRNNGVNPYSGRNYHVSDIIDAGSFPEKHWFYNIFGSMTNDPAKGTSCFGDKAAQWYIVDRNFMQNYGENYIRYIYADQVGNNYRIKAMYNNETRISLIFYDYGLYQTMHNRIFK